MTFWTLSKSSAKRSWNKNSINRSYPSNLKTRKMDSISYQLQPRNYQYLHSIPIAASNLTIDSLWALAKMAKNHSAASGISSKSELNAKTLSLWILSRTIKSKLITMATRPILRILAMTGQELNRKEERRIVAISLRTKT